MDTQSFESLGLDQSLRDLSEAVAQLPQEVIDAAEQLDVVAARHVIDYATIRVSEAQPELWPLPSTQAVLAASKQAKAHADAMLANRSNLAQISNQVTAFNTQIDTLLIALSNIPSEVATTDDDTVARILANANAQIDEFRRTTESEIDQMRSHIGVLTTSMSEVESRVTEEKVRIDAVVTDQQTRWTEMQRTMSEEWISLKQETEENLQATTSSAQSRLETSLSGFEQRADELIADLETLKSDAETLAGAAATANLTHAYARAANREMKLAWVWNAVASLAFVVVGGGAIYVLAKTGDSTEFDWGLFAGRALVAFTFLLLAAFAIKQGTDHRHSEKQNRAIQLKLASIAPFLADLDDKKQIDEVKLELVQGLLGADSTTDPRAPVNSGSIPTNALVEAIKLVKDALGS